MKKGLIITLSVIAAIIITIFVISMINKPAVARLVIEQGSVQLNSRGAWEDAKSGIQLKQGHSLRTLEDSKASIIFYDSSVIRLDSGTEIKISDIVTGDESSLSLTQSSGKTWTKIVKMSGISEYEVETPNAVATVRGTGFGIDITQNGSAFLDVADGSVGFGSGSHQANVVANQSANNMGGDINIGSLRDDDWINLNIEKDKELIEQLKHEIKGRYAVIISFARKGGMGEEEIDEYVYGYILGDEGIKYKFSQAVDDGSIPRALVPLFPKAFRE